jgi:hypothetical protein
VENGVAQVDAVRDHSGIILWEGIGSQPLGEGARSENFKSQTRKSDLAPSPSGWVTIRILARTVRKKRWSRLFIRFIENLILGLLVELIMTVFKA